MILATFSVVESFEDLASLLQRRGRLRGIVAPQGWAEAEKAKAQRNPAAMREHEQIFGQAPRSPAPYRSRQRDRSLTRKLKTGLIWRCNHRPKRQVAC